MSSKKIMGTINNRNYVGELVHKRDVTSMHYGNPAVSVPAYNLKFTDGNAKVPCAVFKTVVDPTTGCTTAPRANT